MVGTVLDQSLGTARLSADAVSLVAFTRESPLYGSDQPEFPRDLSPARKVKL